MVVLKELYIDTVGVSLLILSMRGNHADWVDDSFFDQSHPG